MKFFLVLCLFNLVNSGVAQAESADRDRLYFFNIRYGITYDYGRTVRPATILHLTEKQVDANQENSPCMASALATLRDALDSNSVLLKAALAFARHRAPEAESIRVDLDHAEPPTLYGSNKGTKWSEGFKEAYNVAHFSFVDRDGHQIDSKIISPRRFNYPEVALNSPGAWGVQLDTGFFSPPGKLLEVRCEVPVIEIEKKLKEMISDVMGPGHIEANNK
jgi:hypothetical protein